MGVRYGIREVPQESWFTAAVVLTHCRLGLGANYRHLQLVNAIPGHAAADPSPSAVRRTARSLTRMEHGTAPK